MNHALLTAWRLWDVIYYHCTRLVYVDKANQNIFRIVVKRFWGRPLTDEERAVIVPGDLYIKLHIHNCQLAERLQGINGEMRLGLTALREIKNSLPALAKFVANHPRKDDIRGVVGTTILYRGARHLGFHVQEVESSVFRWYKTAFFRIILSVCHPDGLRRVRYNSDRLVAKRVFMSTDELLSRYLEKKHG